MKLQNIARIIQKTKCLIRSGNKYNMYLSSKKDSNYRRVTPQKGESTIRERNSKRDIRKRILHGDNNNNKNISCDTTNMMMYLPKINISINNNKRKKAHNVSNISNMSCMSSVNNNDMSFTKIIFNNEKFYREQYDNLVYDESLIFNRVGEWQKYLAKVIEKFKREKSNDNLTQSLSQVINDDIKVTLSSIKIIFEDSTNNITAFDFTLPFALIPLFYSYHNDNEIQISIDEIKQILSLIVKFNSTYDRITIDDKEIFNFLQDKERKVSKVKNKNKIWYDEISFIWLTPLIEYKVRIKYPVIDLEIFKENIKVRKNCGFELMIYLYEKKYLNWDFYVVNYLFSLKKFRKIISKTFTKCEALQIRDKKYNLNEVRHYYSIDNIRKLNEFVFIQTDKERNNNLYKVKSCEIKLMIYYKNFMEEMVNEPYTIKLNFFQMKKIYQIYQRTQSIINLLKKFITVNFYENLYCYTVSFDKEEFDSFSCEMFSFGIDKEIESKTLDLQNSSSRNRYTVELLHPKLEIFTRDKFSLCTYTLFSSREIDKDNCIAMFTKTSYPQWPRLLEKVKLKEKEKDDIDNSINLDIPIDKEKINKRYLSKHTMIKSHCVLELKLQLSNKKKKKGSF